MFWGKKKMESVVVSTKSWAETFLTKFCMLDFSKPFCHNGTKMIKYDSNESHNLNTQILMHEWVKSTMWLESHFLRKQIA